MIIPAIVNRRSTRNYKKNDIPDDLILELIKVAQFAPNSHHNRSWEFVLIKSAKTKTKLSHLLGQTYLKQAPLLIVPLIDTQKSTRPIQDLSVASENIFLQAAELSLGTVWKNVPPEKVKEIKQTLNIPQNFTLINFIPVGYPKTKRRPHNDKDFNPQKIHMEKWENIFSMPHSEARKY